jgi:hypothetical protein
MGSVPTFTGSGSAPTSTSLPHDLLAIGPQYPGVGNALSSYLFGNINRGATPYSGAAPVPSTGGQTDPGALTASLTPILKQLQAYFSGQGGPGGVPGLSTLDTASKTGLPTQFASSGMPTDVMPEFLAMQKAQERTIGQQGANLREQFAFAGDLKGSPFGQAATDFYSQTAKDQNALLAQMTQQSLEAARGRQFSAQESAALRQMESSGTLVQMGQQLGQLFQGMDQQAIQNSLAEFVRTQPEYSPLLNMIFALATTYPPVVGKNVGVGVGGALAGSAGSIAQGVSDLINSIRNPPQPAPIKN